MGEYFACLYPFKTVPAAFFKAMGAGGTAVKKAGTGDLTGVRQLPPRHNCSGDTMSLQLLPGGWEVAFALLAARGARTATETMLNKEQGMKL